MRWVLRLVALFSALVFLAALGLLAAGGWSGRGRNAAAVDLQARPEVVFAHLVQPELMQQWLGDLQKVEPLTSGGPRVGAKSRELVGNDVSTLELEVELTKLEPGKLLAQKVSHPEFLTRALYALKDKGTHTTLIFESESQYHHPASRLISPLVTRMTQRRLEADLLRLKTLLEASKPPEVIAAAEAQAAQVAETSLPVDPALTSSDVGDGGVVLDPPRVESTAAAPPNPESETAPAPREEPAPVPVPVPGDQRPAESAPAEAAPAEVKLPTEPTQPSSGGETPSAEPAPEPAVEQTPSGGTEPAAEKKPDVPAEAPAAPPPQPESPPGGP